MDEQTLEDFRRQLLARRSELASLKDTAEESAGVVELDQTSVGRLSRMDALQGQAMSQERRRLREIELKKIAAALARIESGNYGECLDCGEPIALPRLELDPSTTLCITCAGKRESG